MFAASPDSAFPPSALLVLDMQEVFLRSIPGAQSLLKRCRFAAEVALLLDIKVIYTEQVPEKLGAVLNELKTLTPAAQVFAKADFSGLQADGILEYLDKNGIDHLIVAGLETPICIYQTVLDAVDRELTVTVLEDCVGCRRPEDGRCALQYLQSRTTCNVLPSETVFYSILKDSGHPQFREFTSLVKQYSQPEAP